MDLTTAQKIGERILQELKNNKKHAALAVCDKHGDLFYFARTDKARLSTIKIAINKAYTAARDQVETIKIGDMLRDNSLGYHLEFYGDEKFTGWGGGIPVRDVNDNVIGAIGVSGLTEQEDMKYAQLGVDAL